MEKESRPVLECSTWKTKERRPEGTRASTMEEVEVCSKKEDKACAFCGGEIGGGCMAECQPPIQRELTASGRVVSGCGPSASPTIFRRFHESACHAGLACLGAFRISTNEALVSLDGQPLKTGIWWGLWESGESVSAGGVSWLISLE